MRARLVILLALVYVVAFGASIYVWRSDDSTNQPPELQTPGQSNYYVDNPVAYRFDDSGQLMYRMTAKQSLHYPNDSVAIEAPDMRYFAGGPGEWHITARRGRVPPGSKRLRLRDHVRARHTAPNAGQTRVRTSRAWVYPDAKRVTSSAYVQADQPTRRVTGNGMKLDLKTNKLKVLNNADVTYKK